MLFCETSKLAINLNTQKPSINYITSRTTETNSFKPLIMKVPFKENTNRNAERKKNTIIMMLAKQASFLGKYTILMDKIAQKLQSQQTIPANEKRISSFICRCSGECQKFTEAMKWVHQSEQQEIKTPLDCCKKLHSKKIPFYIWQIKQTVMKSFLCLEEDKYCLITIC